VRLVDDLSAIERLCHEAHAQMEPKQGTGEGSRSVPGSRPPLDVSALDPELTLVPSSSLPRADWPTVLSLLESWARMVREERNLAPYGPATAHLYGLGTRAVLSEVVKFHRAQAEWTTTTPHFPLEDYAGEVADCVRALRRWDAERAARGMSVPCPTVLEDGTDCGYRLRFGEGADEVTCRRCRATRTPQQLIAVAACDEGRDVWVDPEAIARHYGVHESTLRRWAARGKVRRSHGRYHLGDVHATLTA
jgi:hypothetical protein